MNIYLIAAESYRLIMQEINKIVKNNAYILMNLKKVTLNDLLKEASYFNIGESKKIIVVTNAYLFGSTKVNEKDNELLINYLNNPCPTTDIIFTTLEGIDLRKKATKIVKEKYHLLNILPKTWREKEDEIQKYVQENKFTIDRESINHIISNTSSLDEIYNELDKIFLFYNKPSLIKINDVKNIVGSIIDNNNFHFVGAVIDKDLKKALKLWQNLKVYKVEPLTLIVLLAREYRNMFYLREYQSQNLTIREIGKRMNLQEWQVNKLYNNSLRYTEKEILDAIHNLANLDIGIKTGKMDKDVALMTFLVEVCA